MKFYKSGTYMITGTVNYLGSYTCNELRTTWEQVELCTDAGDYVRLGGLKADVETRRVMNLGERVTLYISVLGDEKDGSASDCEVWAARDEGSGRVFVSRELGSARAVWTAQIAKWLLLTPIGLLLFVVGIFGCFIFAWASYKILKRLPTQVELDAVAELLREGAQSEAPNEVPTFGAA